jgi:hypothetical protein
MNSAIEELFEQTFGQKEVTLFGEGYGHKIQENGYTDDESVRFILFDVSVEDQMLRRTSVEQIAESFGLAVVPIIMIGTIDEAVELVKSGMKSKLSNNHDFIAEGLVGTPGITLYSGSGKRVIVKVKPQLIEGVIK